MPNSFHINAYEIIRAISDKELALNVIINKYHIDWM